MSFPRNVKAASVSDVRAGSLLAVDLIAEEMHLADKVTTLPEVRRILAVKGYQ
jgi:hypothetical protein